jgi:hypothetical protein
VTTLVLGVAGAVVGGAIGGPLGASIGWSLGAAVGSLLDPPKIEGPRLNDRRLQNSAYGQPIPIVYGAYRLAGNVIWQTDLVEHEQKSGGKGGPETVEYTYSASYAIMICEGPIGSIRRIWADGRVIYDPRESSLALPITVYLGDEEQLPDPTMEADKGAGNVPAHRGTAYVVFTDHYLTEFGNRIPNLEFEVLMMGEVNCPVESIAYEALSSTPGGNGYAAQGGTSIPPYIVSMDNVEPPVEPNVIAQPWEVSTCSWTAGSFGPQVDHGSYIAFGGPLYYIGEELKQVWVNPYRRFDGQGDQAATAWWPRFTLCWCAGKPAPVVFYYPTGVWKLDHGQLSGLRGNRMFYPSVGWDHSSDEPPFPDGGVIGQGIPDWLWVHATVGSHDCRKLLALTGVQQFNSPGDPGISQWWMLVNGVVTKSGTVIPALSVDDFGYGPSVQWQYGSLNAAAMEDNGRYIWSVYGAGGAPTNPVRLYEIDASGNLAKICNSVGFQDTERSFPSPAIAAFANGKCVVVGHKHWEIFQRNGADADGEKVTLASIVSDISERAGLSTGQIDVTELTDLVTGYCVTTRMDARTAIEPLRTCYFFDGIESDAKVKFPKRGHASIATVTDAELAAHRDSEAMPAPAVITRGQEDDLPRLVSLSYVNQAFDYQAGLQIEQRQMGSASREVAIQSALVLDDAYAKRAVDALLYNAWIERDTYALSLTRAYAKLDPTDVVAAKGRELRLTKRTERAHGVLEFEAVPELPGLYNQAAPPGESGGLGPGDGINGPPSPPGFHVSDLVLLNAPLPFDGGFDYGLYPAMADVGSDPWPGATLYISRDAGANYVATLTSRVPDSFGMATSVLANWTGDNTFDERNSVTVQLTAGSPPLASQSELSVLNGANIAILGDEVFQFKNAVLIADRTYTLSGLLRGRRGTEWAMGAHQSFYDTYRAFERFVVMPTTLNVPMVSGDIGRTYIYKAVMPGQTLDQARTVSFLYTGATNRFYSPVHLGGGRKADGEIVFTWIERARISGAWTDGSDVPHELEPQDFRLTIYANSTYASVKRAWDISFYAGDVQEWLYLASEQTADFGSTQATVYWGIAAYGPNGLGIEARGAT